ncbi:MAG: PAS domain-containing sensor histidine kinase [Saprospiraceae bacterium]|nr:PAS domain-containing sensor histidine kinase [Saprospiraceae bacterium]
MNENYLDLAKQLQSIIDTAIDGIITIDSRGTIESINQSAAKIFGYSREELIGKNVRVLMTYRDKEKHDGYISNYLETKVPKIIGIGREVFGLQSSGKEFPMRLAVSEVVLVDRIIFTGIIHDLTDMHEAREEILSLNKSLEKKVNERTYQLEEVVNHLLKINKEYENEILERKEAERRLIEQEGQLKVALAKEKELGELKSRFVSMASHEFRTPLATVLSSVSLIQKYEREDQQVNRLKHIDRIKSAVANLTGILNDFLSLSKLEEGKTGVTLSEIHVIDLLEEVIDETRGLLKPDQKIIISCSDNDKKSCIFQSDRNMLKNIFFNLISNGIKYSERDVLVQIECMDELLTLKFEDQGIGIPEADQKYLFERFFRAGNVSNIQGTGLGLHIVKQYVGLLGGNIGFESVYQKGTTFTIKLPIQKEL